MELEDLWQMVERKGKECSECQYNLITSDAYNTGDSINMHRECTAPSVIDCGAVVEIVEELHKELESYKNHGVPTYTPHCKE
jgi:hypothetical protein